jgi:WD40 repeat protein
LATCSADKTAKIWNVEKNFEPLLTLEGHQRWVWDCAFSADSAYLVTGNKSETKTSRRANNNNMKYSFIRSCSEVMGTSEWRDNKTIQRTS